MFRISNMNCFKMVFTEIVCFRFRKCHIYVHKSTYYKSSYGGFWCRFWGFWYFLDPIKQSFFCLIRQKLLALRAAENWFLVGNLMEYWLKAYLSQHLWEKQGSWYGHNMTFSMTIVTLAYYMGHYWQNAILNIYGINLQVFGANGTP